MWGNLFLDLSFTKSYSFGFLNSNSDIIISLLHWQYWWWFWFSFIISLYYIILIKNISGRIFKFSPKIVSSYRSHGKWGDVIVCLLPVSWCLNILSNSTTLLKIIEWQSEASIMSLRVRGKQWYWVYKIDTKCFLESVHSNLYRYCIGNRKVSLFNLQKNYELVNLLKGNQSCGTTDGFNFNKFSNKIKWNKVVYADSVFFYKSMELVYSYKNFTNRTGVFDFFFRNDISTSKDLRELVFINYTTAAFGNKHLSVNFYKNVFSKSYANSFLTVKQKSIFDWNKDSDFTIANKNNLFLNTDAEFTNSFANQMSNSRLLRVNKILVLPTDVFVNVITNSFDVIHSWFIPGLGFKMDCIPGRSTHHTLFIDLPGLYYGQCAEICGRLHHHMPIKICALQLDHFFIWWSNTMISVTVSDSNSTVRATFAKYNL